MGKGRHVSIWDGVQYRQVSPEEADRLVSKDMAQICPIGGTEMKFRKDFTGYRTREIRAEPTSRPSVEPVAKPAEAKVNWMDYRRAAAESLDKPVTKTTKKETLAYMERHVGTED